MKFKSQTLTQASGSVGGLTFSHNQGGLYTRARSIPTNPATAFQVAVRNFVTQLANNWGSVLTAAQRTEWRIYNENVQFPDAFGDPRSIGAMPNYVRSNVARLQAGLARVDTGPAIFNTGEFSPLTFTVDAATDDVDVAFDNTDDWASEVGSALLLYASAPQSPTIDFYKGPYRFAGLVAGAAVPPTSPATILLPFAVVAGQKIFFQARVTRADGRLSGTFRGSDVA